MITLTDTSAIHVPSCSICKNNSQAAFRFIGQKLLIFLVDLISNKWSLFVAVALPYVGKKSLMILCCATLILLAVCLINYQVQVSFIWLYLVFTSLEYQFLLTVNDGVLVIFLIPTNYQVSFILSCLVFMSL